MILRLLDFSNFYLRGSIRCFSCYQEYAPDFVRVWGDPNFVPSVLVWALEEAFVLFCPALPAGLSTMATSSPDNMNQSPIFPLIPGHAPVLDDVFESLTAGWLNSTTTSATTATSSATGIQDGISMHQKRTLISK